MRSVAHAPSSPDLKLNAPGRGPTRSRSPSSVVVQAPSYESGLSNHFSVRVRPSLFRIWWSLILVLHVVCIGFFGLSAYVYWQLPRMAMGFTFEAYRITLPQKCLLAPALCYAAVALAHTYLLVRLLSSCALTKQFTFDVQSMGWSFRASKRLWPITKCLVVGRMATNSQLLLRIFGRQGFLGIESKYFEQVYIMREVVETMLQSVQAYTLSQLVSGVYLSNVFAIMIFVNCWSTPITLHHFAHRPPLARLICLSLDIGLDFVSTVVVPFALVAPYYQYYDPIKRDFDSLIWYDDVLLVKAMNEFRLVMVTSWSELATRMLFSVSMLTCLENAKSLLQPDHSKRKTQPMILKQNAAEWRDKTAPKRKSELIAVKLKGTNRSFSDRLVVVMHFVFMIWGLAVLSAHIQAAPRAKLAGCALQVRPWLASKSACALMYVNCRSYHSNGSMEDLDELMMQMDESSLVHIVIRHCAHVEIPARIQTFPHLVGMKLYRSTIVRWDNEAALTGNHHANMVLLYIVDVNMTRIPDGLLSEDFPRQLRDIEISGTNLTQLPDVLNQRWQTNGLLLFELCSFPVFPDVLSRMKISILMLGSNHFKEIPAELLINPELDYLILSNDPIESLPKKISGVVSAEFLILDHTLLKTIPSWVNDAFLKNTVLSAVGTAFCEQITATKNDINNNTISDALVRAYEAGTLNCDHVSFVSSPYYPRELENILDAQYVNM